MSTRPTSTAAARSSRPRRRAAGAGRALRRALMLAAALAFAVVSIAAQGQAPERPSDPLASDPAVGGQTGGQVAGQEVDEPGAIVAEGAEGGPESGAAAPVDSYLGEADGVRLDGEEGGLPEGGGPAFVASVLTVGAARDDGLLVGDQQLEDTAYTVTPTLLFLHRPSERSELAIGYEPEIESFQDNPELDAVHHAGGLLWQLRPSEFWRLAVGGSLLDGEDPSRHLDGLILLLPRSPYHQGRAYLEVERRWRFTALQLQLGRTDTEIEPAEGVLEPGVDQTDDTAVVALERAIGERSTLTASYSYVDPTPGRDAVVPEGVLPAALTEPIQSLLLGFGRRLTRRVTLDLAAGVVDDGLEREEGDDRFSYLGTIEVRRRGDDLSLRLRYDRALLSLTPTAPAAGAPAGTPVQSAALRDSVANTLTAGFELSPGPRLRWQQLVRATLAELDNGDDLETLGLTSRLIVPATRRFGVYAQVDHYDQRGGGAGDDGRSRTRYGIGLIVGVSGPPAAWGIREEPTVLLKTLRPDRY